MRRLARQELAREGAMFIALMLVVQALISGLSLGGAAAQPDDAFGQIICATGAATQATPDQPAVPARHGLDCCTLGCSMVGALAPPLVGDAWSHPGPARDAGAIVARTEAPKDAAERTPQNPRAPPRLS
ncbi:MAG TPA: hypothetical protein VNX29_16935 [Kaistia sp.]|nr:hypothetical protein [Kaistia sp.]